jgi:hypothetical protein
MAALVSSQEVSMAKRVMFVDDGTERAKNQQASIFHGSQNVGKPYKNGKKLRILFKTSDLCARKDAFVAFERRKKLHFRKDAKGRRNRKIDVIG